MRERQQRHAGAGQIVAGVLAGVVSFGLHALLIIRGPSLVLGTARRQRPDELLPPIRLEDVRSEAFRSAVEPTPFRPQDPDIVADMPRQAAQFEQPADEVVIEPRALPEEVLDRGVESIVPREGLDVEPAWELRQEILEIEEQAFADDVAVLPRKYVPRVERGETASDVVLPVDRTRIELDTDPRSGPPEAGSSRGPIQTALHTGGPLPGPPVLPEPGEMLSAVKEQVRRVVAPGSEPVTPYKPIEKLLALNVRAYGSSRDPEFTYFRVNIVRAGAESLGVLPKDVIFLQDCSSSITQQKLSYCKDGLVKALALLGPRDRFNIVSFRDIPQRCFKTWAPVTRESLTRAKGFIAAMQSKGKTDIYASLRELFRLERSPARPIIALLISDGQPTVGTTDSSEIIETFAQRNAGEVSVFSLGTVRSANAYLLDLLSFRNRGDAHIVRRGKWAIPDAVENRVRGVSRPILTDVRFQFAAANLCEAYPKSVSSLYLDRPLILYGRCPRAVRKLLLQVLGRAGSEKYDMVFEIDLEYAIPGEKDVRRDWAWQHIYHLVGEHVRVQTPQLLEQIRATARAYGLRVPYRDQLGR